MSVTSWIPSKCDSRLFMLPLSVAVGENLQRLLPSDVTSFNLNPAVDHITWKCKFIYSLSEAYQPLLNIAVLVWLHQNTHRSLQINTKVFVVCWEILYPILNISILMGVVSAGVSMPSSVEHEGTLNGLIMSMKMWLICYDLHSQHIFTQLNTYGLFWTNVLDIALHHHHHQKIKWENIL